jgi:DNA (cytosine-5)-methyltransferase 1
MLRHIELFAGCGGMTLGLHAAGFQLLMANEISPMAGETFAFNHLGVDLAGPRNSKDRVLWLHSFFARNDMAKRLRENPFEVNSKMGGDFNVGETTLSGKLVIGNIDHLIQILERDKGLRSQLFGVDLVSGGPPCQGFSLAGKRLKDDHKNMLPLSFARFCGLTKPKVVLLENVKGIVSPFRASGGVKHHAYLEVAKAFVAEGYYPVCMMVNSKYFGVPQNRPRFIMYAFRQDIFSSLSRIWSDSNTPEYKALRNAADFHKQVIQGLATGPRDLEVFEVTEDTRTIFNGRFFPGITTWGNDLVTARAAIGDLHGSEKSEYLKDIGCAFKQARGLTSKGYLANHDVRHHGEIVKARFRVYQLLNELDEDQQELVSDLLMGKHGDGRSIMAAFDALRNKKLYVLDDQGNGKLSRIETLTGFRHYIKRLRSKKHSQRALKPYEPAPAQLTIPDDLCHYDFSQLRTLTVREMARLQSFPDWFEFKSKATTGGKCRAYEVPQYTQVGNAVPPLLAFALGRAIRNILKTVSSHG